MDCFSLTDLDYETFRDQLNLKAGNQRIPLVVSVEVTLGCNLRCKHCYVPMAQRAGAKQGELTVAEYDRIFSEFAEEGCLWLLLTGGEPLLRPDILVFLDYGVLLCISGKKMRLNWVSYVPISTTGGEPLPVSGTLGMSTKCGSVSRLLPPSVPQTLFQLLEPPHP